MFPGKVNPKLISWIEFLIILCFSIVPFFTTFPYRVNIFLSWEGAYRISQGQIPYKDFGLPLGYGFWIVPGIFFKLFGPYLVTLVKAQAFLNIISGLSFRSILRSLKVPIMIRTASVLLFVLSYSFFNFWPWYNHTVIVYEFAGLAFLFRFLLPRAEVRTKFTLLWLIPAAFFLFFSFFTKQDGGGLALLVALALLLYHCFLHRRFTPVIAFVGAYIAVALLIILPLLPYRFGYWFNHGQPPHNSRLSVYDILKDFFMESQWIKFYCILIIILLIAFVKNFKEFLRNERLMLLSLLSFGILAEAAIFQVTSYTPPDNNIYFHSFAIAFIFTLLYELNILRFNNYGTLVLLSAMIMFWWSGVYFKYIDRIFAHKAEASISPTGENVVSRNNYMISTDTTDVDMSKWIFSSLPSFKKIYMPASTVEGMDRLKQNPLFAKPHDSLKVLNMTELTPLAQDLHFSLEKGSYYPLWHHLGVGMFNEQKNLFCSRISNNYYDIVLYEYAPTLNNFYPFEIRTYLRDHYKLVDTFLAPRRPTNATIEVYERK